MSRRVDRIVTKLGHYFGIISKDGFVSLLLQDESSLQGGAFDIPTPGPALDVASILMDITEGGLTTQNLLDRIKDVTAGEGEDKSDVGSLIKICYEPDEDWTANTSDVLLTPDNAPEGQGAKKGSTYSIRKVAGLPDDSNVNKNNGRPADGEPTMSVIQVLTSRFSPANRDTGALALFLNAMPTLEVSRAVPFIDIVLIQEGEMLSPSGDTKSRINKLSLGQFLLGNAEVENDTMESMILSAKDAAVVTDQQSEPDFTSTDGEEITPQPFSTAGMELFTAPQTLINANETHREYDPPMTDERSAAAGTSEFPDVKRAASVIDRFRPLMTLNSLTFNVVPSGGMMSYKSGKLKFTLHDRSRMAEIAAFVRPSMFRSTHLMIEYGWAHPDAKVHQSPTSADPQAIFGEFIGSLRSKEKYMVVNSSFSFDDVGQVEVELVLSMLSAKAAKSIQIGMSEKTKAEFEKIKDITDLISSIRGRMSSAASAALGGEGNILGALSSPAGTVNLDDDTRQAIRRLQRAARNSDNADLNELSTAIDQLGVGGRGGNRLQRSIEEEIRNKIRNLKKLESGAGDPFFQAVDKKTGKIKMPSGGSANYVSLGKLLSVFVGVPVTSTNFFDDIQIICYNFNDKASYMRNRNIASFPINADEFKTELEKQMENLLNMTIEGFVGFLNTMFLSDPAAKAYGFESLYKSRDDEDRTSRQLSDRYEEDSAALFAEQQKVLQHAYGEESGAELQFKMPTLQLYMETVPIVDTEEVPGGTAKTLLRLHLFDSQNTSYSSIKQMLDASQDATMGLITPAAVAASREGAPTPDERMALTKGLQKAVDSGLLEAYPATSTGDVGTAGQRFRLKGGLSNLKSFIMNSMPSLRYGQEASGITSARLQSMSDPSLTTVNMIRNQGGPEDPVGARESGLPLRVAPVQLSIETIGCPIWNFGQQLFIDFGTGTTVDNIYAVTGIDHSIAAGEFKTSVKLVQLDSYGKFESIVDVVNDAVVAIEGIEEEGS